jgi:hypothetical protein
VIGPGWRSRGETIPKYVLLRRSLDAREPASDQRQRLCSARESESGTSTLLHGPVCVCVCMVGRPVVVERSKSLMA